MSPTMEKWAKRRKRLGRLRAIKRVMKRLPPALCRNVTYLFYPAMRIEMGKMHRGLA